MLVLTRRVEETLIIELQPGIVIRVAVLGVMGAQVRLGIEAPKDIGVWREELYLKIKKERIEAALTLAALERAGVGGGK